MIQYSAFWGTLETSLGCHLTQPLKPLTSRDEAKQTHFLHKLPNLKFLVITAEIRLRFAVRPSPWLLGWDVFQHGESAGPRDEPKGN